jgi:hypothetical protein
VRLFHYHLMTSRVGAVEARYVGKLGFDLIARYGRIGERHVTAEPGTSWETLERDGFKLRLSELQRGAVNVVLQPGHWRLPRVDHIGVVLDDEDEFRAVLLRALSWDLPVQERGSGRTFVSTNEGYRLEVHPPRAWIDDLLLESDELAVTDLRLRATKPREKAAALAEILGLEVEAGNAVTVGDTLVQFLPGGPQGRPELFAERFA